MGQFKRILLKLSGEALMGDEHFGIQAEMIDHFGDEIQSVVNQGYELAVVIGGGNIFRGLQAGNLGIDRVQGDYMGMLATVINGMALQSVLEKRGIETRLMSAVSIQQVCEPYIKRKAVRHLEKGRVIILAAGTGNPFFTTDSAAALRAVELSADALLKGTSVDGIYTADPKKNKDASKFDTISYQEVINRELGVMDQTSFTLCKENKLPIVVFSIKEKGNILKILNGEKIGTIVR
ncbi:MAG: UMP kinase [Chitinophagales bacterium]|nr:UMP kinase [Chitinophagales bacterium]